MEECPSGMMLYRASKGFYWNDANLEQPIKEMHNNLERTDMAWHIYQSHGSATTEACPLTHCKMQNPSGFMELQDAP